MKWETRKVYLYLVSLITFIMLLVGSWTFIVGVLNVVFPGPPPDPCLEALRAPDQDAEALTPDKCEELRIYTREQFRVERTRMLITNGLFLIIVGPAYVYHWRQARRSEHT
ncbi:MAG TPA: hypothetical protein VD902_20860 [Symbiobacteriaceae bacterium]|nr:hypothetical protein [Symbiobacteriaceae bacterium]